MSVFKYLIIGIVYIIIILALKMIYNDVKGINKRKNRTIGLEIIFGGDNLDIEVGGIIPITNELTIGRNNNNNLILTDQYVSAFHARIFLKNTDFFIEDKGSTNGIFVNEKKVQKIAIKQNDKIKIGTALFKVII